jgi:hypothetical protein
MNSTAVKIAKTLVLSDAFQVVHEVYLNRSFTVAAIHLTNISVAAKKVRLCFVPPGNVPNAANAILWDFSVAANGKEEFGQDILILSGYTVQAMAETASSVIIYFSGGEE